MRIATDTRPGLAPAGELLLVDAKRSQKRLQNQTFISASDCKGVQHGVFTCWRHCPVRLPHPCTGVGTGVHGALWRTEPPLQSQPQQRAGANCRIPNTEYRMPHAACRMPHAAGRVPHAECRVPSAETIRRVAWCATSAAALRLLRVLRGPGHGARARMEQYFGAVPPAGEHTVLNAFAVGRTDERSKTFLIPFGVYQKEFACRGESRPGGSAHRWTSAVACHSESRPGGSDHQQEKRGRVPQRDPAAGRTHHWMKRRARADAKTGGSAARPSSLTSTPHPP
jgi:hypothetical protein